MKQEDILKALSTVREPELGRDLVSLGMIKDIKIQKVAVSFKIELTTPACPLKEKIAKEAEEVVKAIEGVGNVSIEMTHRVLAQKTSPDKESIPGVKNIIAVYACKGGVGKSTIATNLAVSLAKDGCSVGLFDADIHGPNIPQMMGVKENPAGKDGKLIPLQAHGVQLMSWGFLSRNEEKPMIWRGPLVASAVRQMLRDTQWGELDYLVVDLPPGTGDAQLTLVQIVPLAGVLIVTTPQDVAILDGMKGIEMFRRLNVPLLGLVENMSGFVCPHCHEETPIFSKGGGEKESRRLKIPFVGAIPLDPRMVQSGDLGEPMVSRHPKSDQSKALRWMAQIVAGQISVANLAAQESTVS